jgi:hypothetical protein
MNRLAHPVLIAGLHLSDSSMLSLSSKPEILRDLRYCSTEEDAMCVEYKSAMFNLTRHAAADSMLAS